MKRMLIFAMCLLLAGCSARTQVIWETVEDGAEVSSAEALPRYCLSVPVPDEAVEVFSGADRLYLDDNITFTVQTLEASSLDELLRGLSGKGANQLTILRSRAFGLPRYDVSWTACGEAGEEIWRCVILDDGQHYYTAAAIMPLGCDNRVRALAEECLACMQLTPNIASAA